MSVNLKGVVSRRVTLVAVLAGLVATVGGAPAMAAQKPAASHGAGTQSGHGKGWYGVWATSVNVRANSSSACFSYPSTANCPTVVDQVSSPEQVYVWCQQAGQTVGGNPYWVYVSTPRNEGFMASYYTDNATNWIDGVPQCGYYLGQQANSAR